MQMVLSQYSGTDVYLGDGATTNRIGSIDNDENGQNGQPLKILFSTPLINASFETGDTSGWTLYTETYHTDLRGNVINYIFVDTSESGSGSITSSGINGTPTYTVELEETVVSKGSYSLKLYSKGKITGPGGSGKKPDGYGSLHGPYVISDEFTAYSGDKLYVEWSAQNGSDAYEVFGFLIGAGANDTFSDGDDTREALFSQRGDQQDWTTTIATINGDGKYKFEFVCGTYDRSGGLAVGASLYIDNIRVISTTGVDDTVVTNIAHNVLYENTWDSPPILSRTLTVDTETFDGYSQSANAILSIIAPDIELYGNNTKINHGESLPSVSNNTDFGEVLIDNGASTSMDYSLANSGTYLLTLTGSPDLINITGDNASDFTVDTQPSSNTIAESSSLLFTVTFKPSAAGTRTAEVQIQSSDPGTEMYTFTVLGTGVTPELTIIGNSLTISTNDRTPSLEDHTIFLTTKLDNDTSTRIYVVENIGNGLLSISGISVLGTHSSDFTIDSQAVGTTLAAGESANLTVTFDPSEKGDRIAEISIISTDADENPYLFSIQGIAYPIPDLSNIEDTTVLINSNNNPITFMNNHVDGSALTLSVASSEPDLISTMAGFMDIIDPANAAYIGQSSPGVAVYTITGSLTITNTAGTLHLTITISDTLLQTTSQSLMITIPNIFTVCASGCNFTSISYAYENAVDSMSIEIHSGTYVENLPDITKDITITTATPSEAITVVTTDLSIGSNARVILSSQFQTYIAGNFTNNGFLQYQSCSDTSNMAFDQSGDMTLQANGAELCSVIIDKNSGITTLDALNIANSLTIVNGDFTNDYELSVERICVDGNWLLNAPVTITDDLIISENGHLDAQGNVIKIGGDWTNQGTFIPRDNRVCFNGTGTQLLTESGTNGSFPFDYLQVNKTGTLNLQTDLIVSKDLTVTSGSLNANGFNIYAAGNWENQSGFAHSEKEVFLNASSGEYTLKQSDPFYNMTIGTYDGKTTIRLKSSITVDNRLTIKDTNTLDLNNKMLTIGKQLHNQGNILANGGVVAFSKITLNQGQGVVYSGGSHADFDDVLFVCEPGAEWMTVSELKISGHLTVDGCRLYASFLEHDGEVTLLNDGVIIRATAIPSLNEWGIIIFSIILIISGMLLRSKKTAIL
jgi:hypothetical protein